MYKHHSKDDGQSYSIKSIEMRIFDSITQNLIWVERCTAYCYNKKLRYYTVRRRFWNRRINRAIIIGFVVSVFLECNFQTIPLICAISTSFTAILAIIKEIAPVLR